MNRYKVEKRDGTFYPNVEAETPEDAATHSAWGFLPLDDITEPFSVLVTDSSGVATRWTVKVKVFIEAERAEDAPPTHVPPSGRR